MLSSSYRMLFIKEPVLWISTLLVWCNIMFTIQKYINSLSSWRRFYKNIQHRTSYLHTMGWLNFYYILFPASSKHKLIELEQQVTNLTEKLIESDQEKEQLKLELRSANISLQDVQQRLHTLQVIINCTIIREVASPPLLNM